MSESLSPALPTVDDVYQAALRIAPWIVKTPFVYSKTLFQRLGAEVWPRRAP